MDNPGLHTITLTLDESERPATVHELARILLSWTDGPLPRGSASWPIIEFADTSGAAAVRGIAEYAEFTVDLDLTNDGYPHERVMIVRVDDDQDVVVCETDEDGSPIRNSTWAIPLEVIKKVTVL